MVTDKEFITQSLELNLFFMRIAKEHSIFIESALLNNKYNLALKAEGFKNLFTNLLDKAIVLSDGVVSPEVVSSGELATDFTLQAERKTEIYSGIFIDRGITKAELSMSRTPKYKNHWKCPMLMEQVYMLNHEAISATAALISFISKLLRYALNCKTSTLNYPLFLSHLLHETRLYMKLLTKLQNRNSINTVEGFVKQQIFWNKIMAEHANLIKELLNPSETDLLNAANNFGIEFNKLTTQTASLAEQPDSLSDITCKNLDAAVGIRDFKTQITQGIISCKIKSIAVPLLYDHMLRETNHFIRLLKTFY